MNRKPMLFVFVFTLIVLALAGCFKQSKVETAKKVAPSMMVKIGADSVSVDTTTTNYYDRRRGPEPFHYGDEIFINGVKWLWAGTVAGDTTNYVLLFQDIESSYLKVTSYQAKYHQGPIGDKSFDLAVDTWQEFN
jgi:hypothetical protein